MNRRLHYALSAGLRVAMGFAIVIFGVGGSLLLSFYLQSYVFGFLGVPWNLVKLILLGELIVVVAFVIMTIFEYVEYEDKP